MRSNSSALYVVRLVLRGKSQANPSRPASSAALAHPSTSGHAPSAGPSAAVNSSTSRISSVSSTPIASTSTSFAPLDSSSFLEPESEEYSSAAQLLPPAIGDRHAPIPFPTMFASTSVPPPEKQKACNPLYRLVTFREYDDALRVYDELTKHGKGMAIQYRMVYMEPAVDALRKGDQELCFKWLKIVPNRPAKESYEGLEKECEPMLKLAYARRNDSDFLERFLTIMGSKGLLPTFLPPLLPHIAIALPPSRSQEIMEKAVHAYLSSTTSRRSRSDRAQKNRGFARDQVRGWWGSYVRKVMLGGWEEEARDLARHPPVGLTMSGFTKKVVYGGDKASRWQVVSDEVYPETLAKQVRHAVYRLPTPNYLAGLIQALSSPSIALSHPTFLGRFHRLFTRSPPSLPARSRPTIKTRLWLHAEILNLQRQQRHMDAIALFTRSFHWFGLPNHPLAPSARSNDNPDLLYPNLPLINTILQSLLLALPAPLSASMPALQRSYYVKAPSFPPALRPDVVTHNIFLREIGYHCGAIAGLNALHTLTDTGAAYEVGEPGYVAVLLRLAAERKIGEMYALLHEMEETEGVGVGPSTYRGLVSVLVKAGLGVHAEDMFTRAAMLFGDSVMDGLEFEEL
ncbi:hypothetical protein IAT38_005797 [Cryptococcus sp. DSM 104549]